MMLRKKTALGLILCTMVLSASVPLLLGIQAAPQAVFGGDMVAISQINSSVGLSASLADELNQQPNVMAASAEITCFAVIHHHPTIVRGVVLDDYMKIENSTIVEGGVQNPERFAVAGKKLAKRISLDVGDRFLLTGSSSSAIFQLEIDGIYEGKHSEDELLVPLDYARKMAGLSEDSVLFIRIKTTNQSALMEDLATSEQPVAVTDSSGTTTSVNVKISEEERIQQQLAIKYLDTARFKSSNGSYVSMFMQEGTNSIRVVVGTFIVLDGALAFIGSAAIISRSIIERRTEIGVISAIGANSRKIRFMILRDVILISLFASFVGTMIGYGLVLWVEDAGLLLMFGETIHAVIDSSILVGIFLTSVIIHICSAVLISTVLTKARPRILMQETDVLETEERSPSLEKVLGVKV